MSFGDGAHATRRSKMRDSIECTPSEVKRVASPSLIRKLETGLSKSPKDYFIHAGLAATYAEMGRAEAATAAAQALLKAWRSDR